jgi:hypothetical protein
MADNINDNKLPFNFTDHGYEIFSGDLARGSGSPGDLSAAIEVMQLYLNETYTYEKRCVKYVVGYTGGRVQILRGPCLYGGIRDLQATVFGVSGQSDLPANIGGHLPGDLPSIIGAHNPSDLNAEIEGRKVQGTSDLPANIGIESPRDLAAFVGGHVPGDLPASIRAWHQDDADLGAILDGVKQSGSSDLQGIISVHDPSNLPASIGGHLPGDLPAYLEPYAPVDIQANIRGWVREAYADLPALIRGSTSQPGDDDLPSSIIGWGAGDLPGFIHSWQEIDFPAVIETHLPRDLEASLFAEQRSTGDLQGIIDVWHISDLPASINIVFPDDLPAELQPIPPEDLPAYLKARYKEDLPGSIHGYQFYDLGAQINQVYSVDLPAQINIITDNTKDLRARIKGYASTYRDLLASITGFTYDGLPASIRATYLADLPGYVFPVVPKNITANIYGWQELDLSAQLNGLDYPWNLTANITGIGGYKDLQALITGMRDIQTELDLPASIRVWEQRFLTAAISGEAATVLYASINPIGYASDLHASIKPKMIRLTSIINVPTMEHKDLSAVINVSCFGSENANLPATLYVKYKDDLSAYIKAIKYNYKPSVLTASTGYTDSYSVVDKLKLSINIYPASSYTEDKYRIIFNTISAQNFLTAYIKGTLRYTGLTASITGEEIEKYTFNFELKNREIAIQKDYAGVFEEFQVVEMSFGQAVKEYYYSSSGDFAWKSDRFKRWMLDVKSYLPSNRALRLKRRLHRATKLYDLRKFNSIDEAMKAAIAFAIEYPQANLTASVFNRGTFNNLSSTINARSVSSEGATLSSSLVPIQPTVIVGKTDGTVEKL